MSFDETVFLTGFPGFIAGRLVQRLASEGARLLLLVQPAFASRAREEVTRIAGETNLPVTNFSILEGDVTQHDLGLAPDELALALAETTTLFHLAAIYDLGVARELAMRVNLEGTRNVNRFAQSIKKLRRYHYVSTCYVAGRRTGVIYENELRHEAGFRNFYEETKYLAEIEVDDLKAELPITIHRPSVVCGDSRTGETAKYDGVYYLIHYLRRHPQLLSLINIGNNDVRLNLVPVDFVIEALTALAKDEQAVGATVQLADPRPLTTHDLFNTIAEATGGHHSRLALPAPLLLTALTLPLAPKVSGLPHNAVRYFFLGQTYDTERATALLEAHGVRCPPFADYVGALVDFVAQHPKL
jgi:nucleoside-diphosphate-sugar epimerase